MSVTIATDTTILNKRSPIRIAINGFGRIGRCAFKAATGILNTSMVLSGNINTEEFEVVAINDLTDPKTLAYLLKYDSVYGRLNKEVKVKDESIVIDNKEYPTFSEKDPAKLPWEKLEVDVVLECTGFFTDYEKAKAHIIAGAKKVIISAPGKGEGGETHVLGTEKTQGGVFTEITSNASCTTNCIAPVMQILSSQYGVEQAFMTTIHSYTASQNIVDSPNKDLREGRAAAENIIPTTTGAAAATSKVIDALKGKFDGIALRVPTPCGSVSDITALLSKATTAEGLNKTFEEAKNMPMYKGILETSRDPLVSRDIIGTPYSSIIDLSFTKVLGGSLAKILSWYDNEWAYSLRLIELAKSINSSQ